MKQHIVKSWPRRGGVWLVVVSAGLLCSAAYSASARDATSEAPAKASAAEESGTNAAPIPLAEVAAQAEAAFASLHSIEGNLSADQATPAIQQDLPVLTRESSARQEESSRMLSSSPSLETLRRLNREWQGFATSWRNGNAA